MSNVMSTSQQERIVALGRLGWTLRRIEESTGSRRETVGKYLRLAGVPIRAAGHWGRSVAPEPPGEGAEAAIEASPDSASSTEAAKEAAARNLSQTSLCEEHRAAIAAAVDKGVCAKVIWEELPDFKGSYGSVKRFVRRLKAEGRPQPPSGIIRTGPGEEAQVDYGQGPMVRDPSTGQYRRTRLFVMTLGWSRKAVFLLAMRSSAEVWAELHEKSFRMLGATPRVVVLDNLAEGVREVDYCDPLLNPHLATCLKHYGVIGVPARVRDPDRKGKVERGVGYAQLRLEHRRFEGLAEAQAFLDHWVKTVADVRVHGTTKRIVEEHFAEELPSMQALPVSPCRRFHFGRRKVRSTGEVEVEALLYPAPATHVGGWVQVQHDNDVVRLIDEPTGLLLVEHRRGSAEQGRATIPAAGKGLSSSLSPPLSPTVELVKRGRLLGSNIGDLCVAIAAVDHEEFAVRRLRAILRRAEVDGVDHVELACKAALQAGAPTYRCVRAWLDHHPPIPLTQIDPLIRELTAYRDVVARCSSTTTQEQS
jgi:transposase